MLEALGASKFLINQLAKGPDVFNTRKLYDAIEKQRTKVENDKPDAADYAEVQVECPADQPLTTTATPDNSGQRDIEKKLRIEATISYLWKVITHYHGQLTTLPEGQQLYTVAEIIRKNDLKIQDLRDQLEYYFRTGTWFDERHQDLERKIDTKDPVQLEREIKNQMSNRSKVAAQLERPLPVAKQRFYQEKFNQLDQKIKYLISLRNG